MSKQKIQKVYPLTPMQEGMLYHSILDPNSSSYFTQLELRISGLLDVAILEKSIVQLVQSYDILRTVFVYQQLQRPRQIVFAERKPTIHFEDISTMHPDLQLKYMDHFKVEAQTRGFELSKDQLFRVALFQLGQESFHLVWSNHHILMDGWSMGILMKKLFQYYEVLRFHRQLACEQEKPYADYIKWLEKQDKEEAAGYWERRLAAFEKPTSLQQWMVPTADKTYRNEVSFFNWDEELVASLKQVANRYKVTPSSVVQAIWGILIGKYNNTDDVVFGTVVSGRPSGINGIENMAGLFINTIPVRVQMEKNASFADIFLAVQQHALEAERYDYIPLYDIQKRSSLKNHLVEHLFAFENFPLDRELEDGSMVERLGFSMQVTGAFEQTNYDFNLIVYPGDQWSIKIMYNASVYDKEWIEKVAGHLTHIAGELIHNPEIEVDRVSLLSGQESDEILGVFNDTKVDIPRDKTIPELFEEQVECTPDNVAVVFNEQQLTYRELNAKANQLARTLRTKGLRPNDVVGIMAERSMETIVGIIAILKAGGAYLPIDPSYPEDRVCYLIEDSGTRIMMTQQNMTDRLQGIDVIDVLSIDVAADEANDSTNLAPVNKPGDLAYIIYTSGSTGKPKGVMVEHRNIVRLVKNAGYIPFSEQDRMAQTGAISFDASTFELFGALLHGASLYPVPKETLLDAVGFAHFLRHHRITTMWLTAPLFNQFARQHAEMFANVRHLIVGGDALTPGYVNQVRCACPGLSLWNGYGPTENTTFSTCFLINKTYRERIPIGKPIGNSTAYIVDARNQLQPIGVPGELCVGGDGVARGYLNRPELTQEKFVTNPFAPGERIYRTGDLARWLPDGNIEFMGRIDNQVKVRGFRIELGEIEDGLIKLEGVREAVVINRQDPTGENYLCAYVIGERDLLPAELRTALSRSLPDYMLPSYFVQLDRMPLTPNGKVDRRELPEPDFDTGAVEYVEPSNEREQLLTEIWQDLLGIKRIGMDDNFFSLGGHSLKAMMLAAKIHQQFQREVSIKVLFERPTIRELAAYLQESEEPSAGPSGEQEFNPIQPAPFHQHYPVSSAQKRMYIVNQLGGASVTYNIPAVLLLEGKLDKNRLEAAFQAMIERHETLRTSFEMVDGALVQRIHENVEFRLASVKALQEEAETLIRGFIRPFDLHRAPLVRAELIQLTEHRHLLLIDMHHIISDGSSTGIFVRDLAQLYHGESLTEPKLHYKDYAVWQNDPVQLEGMKRLEQYWLDTFAGELPVLDLPTDFPRPSERNFTGERFVFGIDGELSKRIFELTAKTDTTLYMFLLAAFKVFLSKYGSQKEVIVGTPAAGRTHAEIQEVPGMFVNTLALRSAPEGNKTFKQFLLEVKETCLQAFAHQNYPLEELIERLHLDRDTSRNPLFNVTFNMQNMDMLSLQLEDLKISSYSIHHHTAKFDLTLEATRNEEEIGLSFDYATALFTQETIRRWSGHLLQILKTAVDNLDIRLEHIELLSLAEHSRLSDERSHNQADYPSDQAFHSLFEAQALQMPDRVALVYTDERLTYRELNEKANRMAWALRQRGIQREDIVGLLMDRSMDMIISILAVMKAGGAYLPIDPEIPQQRIQYVLKDSGARLLITQKEHADKLFDTYDTGLLDIRDDAWLNTNLDNPNNVNQADDLAYIIYTSGTTGNPKGVLLKHRGLVNYSSWFNSQAQLTPADKTVLLSSFAFDLGYTSLFPVLLAGGELHIIAKETYTDPVRLISYLGDQGITYMKLTPSMFHIIVNSDVFQSAGQLGSIRLVVLGGEKINPADLQHFHKNYPETVLINHYGPTETTIGAIAQQIDMTRFEAYAAQPTIGSPIHNVGVYILDSARHMVPVGVVGELYLSGPGLARGYLNLPELTAEKFVANPYVPEETIYKTGDLARRLPNGHIEFMGRIDDQVKIRGYRVELSEIESVMLTHKQIHHVVVITTTAEGRLPELCAYFSAGGQLLASELREWLSGQLPVYMIPSYFVQMESVPLTANGKIDRKALPLPNFASTKGIAYVPPASETEELLCSIWQETLGVEQVGVYDNFFDLGGHSLKAIMLIGSIQTKLKQDIPLKMLFEQPTIRQVAQYMESAATACESQNVGIAPVTKQPFYPVSSAQKRMYVLNQFQDQGVNYNMPSVLLLEGELDAVRLESALRSIVERHESLRTSFREVDGAPVQIVHDYAALRLSVMNGQEEEIDERIRQFIRPFDLSTAPLLRCGLIPLSEHKHLLLIDMHHIIADGASKEIFIKELAQLYRGEDLPKPKLHYKDYTMWQREPDQQEHIRKQERYWLEQFAGEIPQLNLPVDFKRPAVQSFTGDLIRFSAGKETAQQLRMLTSETGTTFHMVLLALFNLFLSKLSGQEEIVVGSAVSGRTSTDVKEMSGMFVNTLALRGAPKAAKTFRQFLQEVKETCLQALEHQDYPFEELIGKLNLHRDMSRNPLFNVMLTVEIPDKTVLQLDRLSIRPYEMTSGISKFDLTLGAFESAEEIGLQLEYATDLFKKETVTRWCGYLLSLMYSVAIDPDIRLSDIELVTAEEKHRLLDDWNQTDMDVPTNKTIHQLFEAQVLRTPDHAAVAYNGQRWMYRELNARANRLARLLMGKELGADQCVGIMVKPSLEMAAGVLGILKAGASFVPIDPDYPEQRIAYVLADSGTAVLLTQSGLPVPKDFGGEVILLDGRDTLLAGELCSADEINPQTATGPRHLAYMIYTSGTTGQPKGVMVEHCSLVNLCFWHNDAFKVSSQDRSAKYAGFGFDASVWEMFPYWIAGAEVHIIGETLRMDIVRLNEYFEQHGITITFLPTQLCEQFMELDNHSLRILLTGGDKLKRAAKRRYALINNYGPTESTVVATSMVIEPGEETLTIGRPIANTRVYILGAGNQVQPIGVAGELCIAGRGLARGYNNRPEETAEKFVADLFVPGERMYRTGDMARWLENGSIEYLGRIDQQVKVRGYRIELSEIEAYLTKHPSVKAAIVTDVPDAQGNTALCAYVVATNELQAGELQTDLARKLPEYMVPQFWVKLDALPMTPNGKVDRRSLPQPDIAAGAAGYKEPVNEAEALLVNIWKDVLGMKRIGTHDNFFTLGGDSIKAIQMASRLYKHGWKLEMKDLFRHPTIEQVSPFLQPTAGKPITQGMIEGEVKLTPIQRWFFNQRFRDMHHWNQSVMLHAPAGFNPQWVKETLHQMTKHHDALRMVYMPKQDGITQYNRGYHGDDCFSLEVIDLHGVSDIGPRISDYANQIQASIDLSRGPLLKTAIFQTEQGDHLLIVIHHLVVDGVSWRIFLEDLASGYLQASEGMPVVFQEKTNSFKEWATELETYANTAAFLKQADYWRKIETESMVPLPKDNMITSRKVKDSAVLSFELTQEETQLLMTRVHKAYRTEINDILLCALGIAIREWTGEPKIYVNMEAHGREEIIPGMNISRTIGWFTAQYPVVLTIEHSTDLPMLIKTVKENLRSIPNKGIGYGMLRYLMAEESRTGLDFQLKPEVSFNYLGQFDNEVQTDFFGPSPYDMGKQTSQEAEAMYALNFIGIIRSGELFVSCSFNKQQYLRSTVSGLLDRFKHHLLQILYHCATKEDRDFTPSDFSASNLQIDEVSDIMELLEEKLG